MTLWPLVERELRSAARQRFTYFLRLTGAAAAICAAAVYGLKSGFVQSCGGELFGALHLTLFAAIWLFAPFLTADSISREQREGTLGLLFLTRLGARDIVLAKGFAHGLRAMALWLAVLPILSVAFLLGGVGWREALLSACYDFGSILLALAAGLLASALTRTWTRILVYVTCLGLLFCTTFVIAQFLVAVGAMGLGWLRRMMDAPAIELLGISFTFATDVSGQWSQLVMRMAPTQKLHWMEGAALLSACAVAVFWLVIWLAARRVRRVWREEPAGTRTRWLADKFCRPVFFRNLFRWWMQRRLRLNPVGWLEQRSWTGRMISWIWLGLVMLFACPAILLPETLGNSGQAAHAMAALMVLSLSLSAAASFRRERETGVLELLLVSPLGEASLISGRVRGLWMQFLPGAALLIGIWSFAYHLGFPYDPWNNEHSELEVICFSISSFLAVPLIGLYFSLRFRAFPLALLATIAVALLAPVVTASVVTWLDWLFFGSTAYYSWDMFPCFQAIGWQLILAGAAWYRLWRRLKTRAFPMTA